MFFVKSNESLPCPLCGGHLISRDSRRRRLIRDDGNSITLQIRRLLCKKCNTLHSELPDIVQPFKHYASSVIQKVLDGRTDDCPAEDTTIRHWIHEFCGVLEEVNAALVSLWIQKKGIPWTLLRQISLLQKIRSRHTGHWYAFVNRMLINSGVGTYTRFACHSPDIPATLSPT